MKSMATWGLAPFFTRDRAPGMFAPGVVASKVAARVAKEYGWGPQAVGGGQNHPELAKLVSKSNRHSGTA